MRAYVANMNALVVVACEMRNVMLILATGPRLLLLFSSLQSTEVVETSEFKSK